MKLARHINYSNVHYQRCSTINMYGRVLRASKSKSSTIFLDDLQQILQISEYNQHLKLILLHDLFLLCTT